MTGDPTHDPTADDSTEPLTCRLCTTPNGALFVAVRQNAAADPDGVPVCRSHASLLEDGEWGDGNDWAVYALLEHDGRQGLDRDLTAFAMDVVDWAICEVQNGRQGHDLDRLGALKEALEYEHSKFPVPEGDD